MQGLVSNDRRFTSGFVVYISANPNIWSSKKQASSFSFSIMHWAESWAIANAAFDIIWVKGLLAEIRCPLPSVPMIWYDNMSILASASNSILYTRTKYVELDLHFIREKVLSHQLSVQHISTSEKPSDTLTKPLSINQFLLLRSKLNVILMPLSLKRGNGSIVGSSENKTFELLGDAANCAQHTSQAAGVAAPHACQSHASQVSQVSNVNKVSNNVQVWMHPIRAGIASVCKCECMPRELRLQVCVCASVNVWHVSHNCKSSQRRIHWSLLLDILQNMKLICNDHFLRYFQNL